jgi:hypothetical protein
VIGDVSDVTCMGDVVGKKGMKRNRIKESSESPQRNFATGTGRVST